MRRVNALRKKSSRDRQAVESKASVTLQQIATAIVGHRVSTLVEAARVLQMFAKSKGVALCEDKDSSSGSEINGDDDVEVPCSEDDVVVEKVELIPSLSSPVAAAAAAAASADAEEGCDKEKETKII